MSYPVTLYIYDLSQGMARSLGPTLGLHDLEGVWHTGVVVHGIEILLDSGWLHTSNGGPHGFTDGHTEPASENFIVKVGHGFEKVGLKIMFTE